MKKISVYTISLGCPKNQVDTEWMLGGFGAAFVNAAQIDTADVVLINTCGFIRPAVDESIATILDVADEIQGLGTKPVFVVTGCLVSRYGKDLEAELPEVDLFLDIASQKDLGRRLEEILSRPIQSFSHRMLSSAPSFAYLKIAEGCNNHCRFCVIPGIRGKLVSREVADILEDARHCLRQGRKELVVVAQDVTAYGEDFGGKGHLERLVGELAGLDGLFWLWLMYLYPAGLTSDVLSFLSGLGKPFVPYFDIPLQHAHADILTRMGRPFRHNPRELLDRVRHFFPHAALRTSLIVGYPGETDAHFQALEDFVRETRFTQLGVFPYYAEDGSPAAKISGQVPEDVKLERRERIMEVQAEISEELLGEFQDMELDVLVDKAHEEWPGLFEGRVWFQAPEVDGVTYVSGEDIQVGQMTRARIEESKVYDLVAFA